MFLGFDGELDRSVAINSQNPQPSPRPAGVDDLIREAQKAAALRHPSIVTIFDVGRLETSGCYVVMEYVEGESLRSIAQTHKFSYVKIADLMAHVADGLSAAPMR